MSSSRITSRRFMQNPECSMLKHFTLIGRHNPGEEKSRNDSTAEIPTNASPLSRSFERKQKGRPQAALSPNAIC